MACVWRQDPRYPSVETSTDGRLRYTRTGKLCAIGVRETGHRYAGVRVGSKVHRVYVHAAMLRAFVGPCPPGHESRHLDGNPGNNRLSNLAWGTRHENSVDRLRHGRSPVAKLSEAKVREIRRSRQSNAALASRHGVAPNEIGRIRAGLRWAHVAT